MTQELQSNCCRAPLITRGSNESTYHFECEKCSNPADPYCEPQPENTKMVEINTVFPVKEESWEERVRYIWSEALDEETERRYGMSKHHPPEDCPLFFIKRINDLLLSKAEEIKKYDMRPEEWQDFSDFVDKILK